MHAPPTQVAARLDAFGPPYVVKDDGLAAGKGVVVTDDRDEALAHAAVTERVVIEEFLDGPEVSLFAITDGATVVPLLPAQDFKRALDGDAGPNTGGMGAYAPLPWAPEDLVAEVTERVLQPTVDEMASRGTPFAGLLYAGLALTKRGVKVIEFNARFGDPETQPLLALLASPLGVLLQAAAEGRLHQLGPLTWHDGAAVAVVVAADGYPAAPRTGDRVHGLAEAERRGRGRRAARRHRHGRRRPRRHLRAAGSSPSPPAAPTSRRPGPGPTPGSTRSASTAATTAPTSPQESEP